MKKEAVISFNGVFTPAEIMLNHNLTPNAKLLYGLIRSLSKSSKGCWATNRWLGQILNVNPTTISTLISSLQSESCIHITYAKKVGLTNETVRHIYVNDDYFNVYRQTVIDFNDTFLSDDLDGSFEKSQGGFKQNLSSPPFEKSQDPLLKNHNGGTDKSKTPIRKIRTNINNNIKKNIIKNNNKKHTRRILCGLNQNELIPSVPPLSNSSVQKPKVSGRPARKPIQEIVAPDPHLIIVTDLERISKKFYPNNKITSSQLKAWLSEIKKLFRKWSGSVDDLHQMLRTYYTNYDPKNKYHVVIRSGSSLKEKINQLESFCDRLQTDSKPTVKRYQENFKSDTKGKYDNIKEEVIDMDEED